MRSTLHQKAQRLAIMYGDGKPAPVSRVTESDVRSTLVAKMNPDVLLADSRTRTTTFKAEYSVRGHHFFLVIGRVDELWLMVPLFSRPTPWDSRRRLDNLKKHGETLTWFAHDTYVHEAQMWLAPTEAIIAADVGEGVNGWGDERDMADWIIDVLYRNITWTRPA